jgi:hypothetical protein
MTEATLLPFDLPAVRRKKLTVDFDGGSQSSDGGLLLLREAERELGICARLAGSLTDRRDPTRISHSLVELISGRDLCSQATMSRLENMPSRRQAVRLTAALIDQFCSSFPAPPDEITLDIDDTLDIVYGGQQLSFWNGHHEERCFLPIHVYHVESGKPVVAILRTGKTPAGREVRCVIKHITRRIRRHWPNTRICWRGDSHYGRVEAMQWCEANNCDYIFGFQGSGGLDARVAGNAEIVLLRHAASKDDKVRACVDFEHKPKSWTEQRRFVARIEVSFQETKSGHLTQATDIRYCVTSLKGEPDRLYETVYCARGQAENLIKLHKAQLASDRTSCHSATANQVRLVLHTAAYWLMHALRSRLPAASPLARAEFATLRLRLIKIGARVIEHAARIRVHLPTSCPERSVFAQVAAFFMLAAPS